MSSSLAAVPELVDRIVDHLHDDEETLRACALVARTWLPTSRFHLLHHIHIASAAAFHSLLALLEHTPGAGAHARALALGLVWDVQGAPTVWIRPPLALAPLATHLPHVRRLTLNDDWTRYGDANRAALLAGFRSVDTLDISSSIFYTAGDALGLLQSFPLLEHLSLQYIDIGDPNPVVDAEKTYLHLKSLRVEVADDVHEISWHTLAPSLISPVMTSLSIPLSSAEDLSIVHMHCSFAANTLTELRLDTYAIGHATTDMPWETFSLPPMPHLAALHIGRLRLASDESARAFTHALGALLRASPDAHPALASVVVRMGPEPPVARTVYFWTPVVRALTLAAAVRSTLAPEVAPAPCTLVLVMPDRKSERRTLRFVHAAVPALVDHEVVRVVGATAFKDHD